VKHNWLSYIDKLQRENGNDIAFYPLDALATALESGHIITGEENGVPAGYLWHGPIHPSRPIVIYQACIDYDLRRRQLGHNLVRQLIDIGKVSGATAIRLGCASSSESTQFWQAIGFYVTNVTAGGHRRKRDINHFWADLRPTLLVAPSVTPSTVPVDERQYFRDRRKKINMPSRFSRGHY
jgi:ribosomal protein S18 acetylase RimI-like enzyme